jgi:hypothetical protein
MGGDDETADILGMGRRNSRQGQAQHQGETGKLAQ